MPRLLQWRQAVSMSHVRPIAPERDCDRCAIVRVGAQLLASSRNSLVPVYYMRWHTCGQKHSYFVTMTERLKTQLHMLGGDTIGCCSSARASASVVHIPKGLATDLRVLQQRQRVGQRHIRRVQARPQRRAAHAGLSALPPPPLPVFAAARGAARLTRGPRGPLRSPPPSATAVPAIRGSARCDARRSGCMAAGSSVCVGVSRVDRVGGGRGGLRAAQLHVRAVGPAAQRHGHAGRRVGAQQPLGRCMGSTVI